MEIGLKNNMMSSSVKEFNFMLFIIFHLYHPVSDGEHNLQVMTNGFTQVLGKLGRDFQEPEVVKGDDISEEILPLVMTHLTPALVERARREMNETDEIKQKALVELRKMIEAEENLVSPTDDLFLLAFLRKFKFDVDTSFKRVQDYWTFISEYSYIYDNLDLERVLGLLEKDILGFLQYRDKEGSAVLVVKVGMLDTDEDLFENALLSGAGLIMYGLKHESTQVAGYRIIYDVREIGWRHLKYLAPSNLYISIRATYTLPARYKKIHVLGEESMLKLVWYAIYPFLPEKLKKILVFHGEDFEVLQDFIHPSALPEEYGGSAPHFSNDMDNLREIFSMVAAHLNYGYKN